MTMLQLSSADQARLGEALRVMFSAAAYEAVDEWRHEVNRTVQPLLGADRAHFQLPLPGIELVYGERATTDVVGEYQARYGELAERFGIDRRKRELGVYNRELIWAGHIEEYLASEYYNEFIAPNRYFDAVEMTVPLGPAPGDLATLWCHHESEQGPLFGERGLALLRLLYPAFRHGVESCAWLTRQHERLVRVIDEVTDGVLLCSRDGLEVHRSAALVRLLQRDPEGPRVVGEMGRLARSVAELCTRSGDCTLESLANLPTGTVRTTRAVYRIRATRLAEDGEEGLVAVSVVHVCGEAPEPMGEAALRERFGLSRAEARVARYLSEGSPNDEIAKRLCISPHTARHHTESILRKLGVASRTAAAARILAG